MAAIFSCCLVFNEVNKIHKTTTTLDKQRFAEVSVNIDFYKRQYEKKEENYVYSKNKKYFKPLQSCFADCQPSKKQQNSDVNINTPTNINNRYKDVIQLINTVGNYSKSVVELEEKRF